MHEVGWTSYIVELDEKVNEYSSVAIIDSCISLLDNKIEVNEEFYDEMKMAIRLAYHMLGTLNIIDTVDDKVLSGSRFQAPYAILNVYKKLMNKQNNA